MTKETLKRAQEIDRDIATYTCLQNIVSGKANVFRVMFRFVTKFSSIESPSKDGSIDVDMDDLFDVDEVNVRIQNRILELQKELDRL